MSDPQDIIADKVSDIRNINKECKTLHRNMLDCISNYGGTMKCRDLIDQWHDCRTSEKDKLKNLYDLTTVKDAMEIE
tara:strand:+ start:2555 stop:2785 length:231 start_codon:yes stop_codon:yes gene_type:complete